MANLELDKLDEVIHAKLRLGIMSYLAANAGVADFTELKMALTATQGNLSVHLRKLEEAGYVSIEKSYLGRKPNTKVHLTKEGRQAFSYYLENLGKLLEGLGVEHDPAS